VRSPPKPYDGRVPASDPAATPAFGPAEMYDRYYGPAIFGPWAGVLLQLGAPRAGERVLDLACGTGIVSRQLAPLVGPSGALVAADLRETMLAVARSHPAPAGATIDWRQADASALPLPDRAFDLVVCQQGLQFFPDRPAALRHVRRVLVPGGRAAFAVWQALPRQPVFAELAAAELRHLAPLGITAAHATAPFSLGDAGELRRLFEEAGFSRVEVLDRAHEVRFSAPDDFVANSELAYAGVMPDYLKDPAAFQRFVEAIERELQPTLQRHRQGDHLVFPLHANLVLAHVDRDG
jgi:ubiquinone/menaquinone biosynthesis C-methylase UbiE